ncbi:MAG: glycosyltransferase [Candidatus Omnitrophica bacterium]|nr:glycosyltransferase [Candidatus Omnitrophota bacterium]
MNQPLVSIIVPAYNSSQTIAPCLEAIIRQSYPCFEIIVVDDGSTDQTAEIIRTFPNVHYARQENAGPASARNHGARIARGEFFIFTDSDCVPQDHWVELLMKNFLASDIGVVAGSYGIANPESRLARCVWKEILFRHQHLMPDYPRAFGSYNFAIRRKTFEDAGGFDESYRRASGEDNDLSYKVSKAGYKIYFSREALVDHYHPTKFFKYLNEQYRHGFWRAKLYGRHIHMARGDDYTFLKDIAEIFVCGMLVLCLPFVLLAWGIFIVELLCLVSLLIMEAYYSFKFNGFNADGISYIGVMGVRTFYRFFGLASGIFNFFIKKN